MRGAVEFPVLCAATSPLEMPIKNNNSKRHGAVVVPGTGLCLIWKLHRNSYASPFLVIKYSVNFYRCQETADHSWFLRTSQGDNDQAGFMLGARELAFPLWCSQQWTLTPSLGLRIFPWKWDLWTRGTWGGLPSSFHIGGFWLSMYRGLI